MRIIGIAGPIGSGKNEVARFLTKQFKFTERAWADPLYEEVAKAYQVPVSFLQDRSSKELPQYGLAPCQCTSVEFVKLLRDMGYTHNTPLSPRFVLERWGTEYRRAQDEDYWVEQMAKFAASEKLVGLAIPGTRFANEVAWVRRNGGEVWYVDNPSCTVKTGHQSDQLKPEHCDRVIDNSGSVLDLYTQVNELIER